MKQVAFGVGLVWLSFLVTLLVFVYRYMWFTTETIPPTRIGYAVGGSILWGITFGIIKLIQAETR